MRKKILSFMMGCGLAMVCMVGCGDKQTDGMTSVDIKTTETNGDNPIVEQKDTTENSNHETDNTELQSSEKQTISYVLLDDFKYRAMESSLDIEAVASELVKNAVLGDIAMVTMPVQEGYLNGFDKEIKGFKKGVMFSPMIGSMPIVGYIFETDAPETLVENLKASHQLNWNICTTADEMVVDTVGDYVFFVMAPKTLD